MYLMIKQDELRSLLLSVINNNVRAISRISRKSPAIHSVGRVLESLSFKSPETGLDLITGPKHCFHFSRTIKQLVINFNLKT